MVQFLESLGLSSSLCHVEPSTGHSTKETKTGGSFSPLLQQIQISWTKRTHPKTKCKGLSWEKADDCVEWSVISQSLQELYERVSSYVINGGGKGVRLREHK